ncbi:MAG: VWA domain-containing protein [Acidobacteria bacterium]|nr:VWA domain-containing protein [Acidobacteriota bacterium]
MLKTVAVRPVIVLLLTIFTAAVAHTQSTTISIPVWIGDSRCATVPDFKPTLNGKLAPVSGELGPASDQIILIVFDLTGDIARIEAAKQAVIADISKLPRNTWVGLMQAQDGLHVLADPSPNRQKAIEAIRALSTSGNPELLNTVRSALSLADTMVRKYPVRVAVFFITDGSIYSYQEDYTNPVINPSDPNDLSRRFPDVLIDGKISRLEGQVDSLEAPLFVVHLEYRADELNMAYQNGLESLARRTGGDAVMCRTLSEIPQAISTMFDRITTTWRLTLTVPPKTPSHVQVGLSALCGKGDLQASWRTHFYLKGE